MSSHLEVIAKLEDMLRQAIIIIKSQAELLDQHGIGTDSGELESRRDELLEKSDGWC